MWIVSSCKNAKRLFRITGPAVLPVMTLPRLSWPQEFCDDISGHVTEISGEAVPNAKVTITNITTNISSASTTNEAGDVTVRHLSRSLYTITVAAQGFKKSLRDNPGVPLGEKLKQAFTLEVGPLPDTVSVTSEASGNQKFKCCPRFPAGGDIRF